MTAGDGGHEKLAMRTTTGSDGRRASARRRPKSKLDRPQSPHAHTLDRQWPSVNHETAWLKFSGMVTPQPPSPQ